MNNLQNKKILIVGLGLIGGSYASALSNKGYYVGAVTKDSSSIEYALKHNIIKEGITIPSKEFIEKYDFVVFALYPKIFVEWIENYQQYLKSGIVITDVTGIKSEIVYKIQTILRKDIEFIPAHPMAGREVYGVENSDPNLFKGANYIITPTSENTPEAIGLARTLGEILEFKSISILTPEEHDEMIGFLSQLTHCIAVALMTCKDSRYLVDYTGDSFRDLTRIAKINEFMWTELFLMNKNQLLSQMDLFLKQFKELRDALAKEDAEKMKEIMRLSTERRKYFDKKESD
ncbi:MAG: prephenate dehydrogenase [Erysipelotrichaceae bacterium]|nr:prephenate dehydrogenase [Erysipelotrichaceae bacterium]